MIFIYKFARNHYLGERKHERLGDALEDAAGDMEFGLAYPKKICLENGQVVKCHDEIVAYWRRRD